METPQEYYRHHGPMSAPGAGVAEIRSLPKDLAGLCAAIQGMLIHRELANFAYKVVLSEQRRDEANLRPMPSMLEQIHALDGRPLGDARQPDRRMACVCRHFTLTLVSILRERGTPARARCGFGAYFNPGRFEDHWVCEYWNETEKRWILVDAQLDATQWKLFKPDFNPLDVPHDQFIIAGDAWRMCRSGRADPAKFGLSFINLQGLWFVAGNLIRDLAALNKVEMLPWDVWGMMTMDDAQITDDQKQFLDRVAAITIGGDDAFPEVRRIYESDERVRMPGVVFNAMRQAPEKVVLA